MPNEIKALLFGHIADAASQVALALTCKTMALVATGLNLTRAYISRRFAGLLPKEAFDVPNLMKCLSAWAPESLKLCNHCLTLRPHDRTYWLTVQDSFGSNLWIQKVGWTFSDGSWQKQMHDICPLCHVSCSLSDYVDCDGCRALGRMGDVDWSRVGASHRERTKESQAFGIYAT